MCHLQLVAARPQGYNGADLRPSKASSEICSPDTLARWHSAGTGEYPTASATPSQPASQLPREAARSPQTVIASCAEGAGAGWHICTSVHPQGDPLNGGPGLSRPMHRQHHPPMKRTHHGSENTSQEAGAPPSAQHGLSACPAPQPSSPSGMGRQRLAHSQGRISGPSRHPLRGRTRASPPILSCPCPIPRT